MGDPVLVDKVVAMVAFLDVAVAGVATVDTVVQGGNVGQEVVVDIEAEEEEGCWNVVIVN